MWLANLLAGVRWATLETALVTCVTFFAQPALTMRSLRVAFLLAFTLWALPFTIVAVVLMRHQHSSGDLQANLAFHVSSQLLFAGTLCFLVFVRKVGRPALRPLALVLVCQRTVQAVSLGLVWGGVCSPALGTALDVLFAAVASLGFVVALYMAARGDTLYWRGLGRGYVPTMVTMAAWAGGDCCGIGPLRIGSGLRAWGLNAVVERGTFQSTQHPAAARRAVSALASVLQDAALRASLLKRQQEAAARMMRGTAAATAAAASSAVPSSASFSLPGHGDTDCVADSDTDASSDRATETPPPENFTSYSDLPGSDLSASIMGFASAGGAQPVESPIGGIRVKSIVKASSLCPRRTHASPIHTQAQEVDVQPSEPPSIARNIKELRAAVADSPPSEFSQGTKVCAWVTRTAPPGPTGTGSTPSAALSYMLGGVRAVSSISGMRSPVQDALQEAAYSPPEVPQLEEGTGIPLQSPTASTRGALQPTRRRTRSTHSSVEGGVDSGEEADYEGRPLRKGSAAAGRRAGGSRSHTAATVTSSRASYGSTGNGGAAAFEGAQAEASGALPASPAQHLQHVAATSELLLKWGAQPPGLGAIFSAYGGRKATEAAADAGAPGSWVLQWSQDSSSTVDWEDLVHLVTTSRSGLCCLRSCTCWVWSFPFCFPRSWSLLAGVGEDATGPGVPVLSDAPLKELQNFMEEFRDIQLDFASLQTDDVIHEGSAATVFHGLSGDRPAAIKVFRPPTQELGVLDIREIRTEARFCRMAVHPNIVQFYGVCVCPPDISLVFELCERGTLRDILTVLQEQHHRLLHKQGAAGGGRHRLESSRGLSSTQAAAGTASGERPRVSRRTKFGFAWSQNDLWMGHGSGLGSAGQGFYGLTSDSLLAYHALQALRSKRGALMLSKAQEGGVLDLPEHWSNRQRGVGSSGLEQLEVPASQCSLMLSQLPDWLMSIDLPHLQEFVSKASVFTSGGFSSAGSDADSDAGEAADAGTPGRSLSPLPMFTLQALAKRSRTVVHSYVLDVPRPSAKARRGLSSSPLRTPLMGGGAVAQEHEYDHAEIQIAEMGAANVAEEELYHVCDLRVRLGMALHAASAVAYLHSADLSSSAAQRAKLVHRDIKSLNFLVTDDFTVKLADFGDSRLVAAADAAMTSRRGTLRWAAPEVMQGQGEGQYSERVDIYSLGIVLWEMLTGEVPFAELSEFAVVSQVVAGARPKVPPGLPVALRRLLRAMWHRKPSRRPTAAQVCQLLRRLLNRLNVEVERMFWLQQRMPPTGLRASERRALEAIVGTLQTP